MKRLFENISLFVAAALIIGVMGCSKDDGLSNEEGFGVALRISLNSDSRTTESSEFDYSRALTNSVIKIYDSNDNLIRRYEPISNMPDYIYLVEGDYHATVVAGESLSPSEDQEDMTFEGSGDFTVTASTSCSLSITCPMINNVMTVSFDSSLDDNFEEGYSLIVAQTSEITDAVLADSYPYKKVFTKSGTTYFVQPDEVETLTWQFEGTLKYSDGATVIKKSGSIDDVVAGVYNTLSFSYEKELNISTLNVLVDTSEDKHNDIFEFSPQPTVLGSGFDIAQTQLATGVKYDLNIDGIYELSDVSVIYGGETIATLVDGSVASDLSGTGLSFSLSNEKSGVLTFSNDYFDAIGVGGDQTIEIYVEDIKNSATTKEFMVTTTGVVGLSSYDYWNNTGAFTATILDSSIDVSTVTLEYRIKDSGNDWVGSSVSLYSGYNYTAQASPTWSSDSKVLDEGTVSYYSLDNGVLPNTTYECRLLVDGVARETMSFTSDDTTQTIPYGDMNDYSLSCWTSDNSNTTNWGSGNNSNTPSLCTYDTVNGEMCAKLTTGTVATVIAAGNIFYSQFTFASWTGTVYFGQPFTWSARPRSLNVKYAASLASGSITVPNTTTTYSHDRARIFAAIVDWSSRHEVSASTSTATGIWDPETQTETSEGKIIGYASIFIDSSTTTSELHQLEIPFYYYDTETKPSGDYTIVISAASSAYGDYKIGVDGSVLYLDDFEFGY